MQKKLLQGTLILTVVLVMLGAYTRLSDAGLGCPDWPGCYGQLTVPNQASEIANAQQLYPQQPLEADKAWIEMLHRYLASSVGFLIVLMLINSWRKGLDRKYPGMLFTLVLLQGLLGMWTVTMGLLPIIVTAHLFGGFATLTMLWLYYRKQYLPVSNDFTLSVTPAIHRIAGIFLLLVIGQIFLGGWTSTNYAALICPDLPMCRGQWWPETDFVAGFSFATETDKNWLGGLLDEPARTAIHLSHRIGAIIVASFGCLLCWQLWRQQHFRHFLLIAAFLSIQISLGISNILFQLPIAVAVAHNGVAVMLLIAVTDFYWCSSAYQSVASLKTQRFTPQLSINMR